MGTVVKRCGVRAISSGRLSNSKNAPMTIHPFGKKESILKPQPLPLPSSSEDCQPATHQGQLPFVQKIGLTVLVSVLFFVVFGEDSASQQNRRYIRYNGAQLSEMMITLNHLSRPMPWGLNPLNADDSNHE